MKELAEAALAACAQLKPSGGSDPASTARPDWLRDPARGDYPYSPKGW